MIVLSENRGWAPVELIKYLGGEFPIHLSVHLPIGCLEGGLYERVMAQWP